uniref:Myb-like domain-containing protein n=1 Tax=Rhizophora mucronata TaxID=61149 RepID=A0A2P2L513_RHIMU
MIHKRPYVDDDSDEVACKHPRQFDYIDDLSPIVPLENAYEYPQSSGGQGNNSYLMYQDVEKHASGSVMEVSDNVEMAACNSFPCSLWMSNESLESHNLSIFPEYFESGQQQGHFFQSDENSPLNSPIKKRVPVGPEHQAFIPKWNSDSFNASFKRLSGSQVTVAHLSDRGYAIDDNCGKFMGICVIPMPESKASASYYSTDTKSWCSCPDGGSIRCVRQHIMEARKKLRNSLGEETFEGLGFCDMGEEVAKKWTEEEEQAFYEVVLSNPTSMGKNFWELLSAVFPYREQKEIVSYYFNVFMLQQRAEQNRFDPLNVDSDDDEWQCGKPEMTEEDEDSVVESPTISQEDQIEGCNEYIEDDDDIVPFRDVANNVGPRVATEEEYEGDVDDISEADVANLSGGHSGSKHFSRLPSNEGVCYDVQDDSCTSYEYQRDHADCFLPVRFGGDEHQSDQ